jgi:hypothetical protein
MAKVNSKKETETKKTTNNKKTLLLILIIVLCLSIGYAALTEKLSIIGDIWILHKELPPQGEFDVHWENINVTKGSNLQVSPAVISAPDQVNYSIHFNTPGQVFEFTVDAVNKGDYDAVSTNATKSPLTAEQSRYLTYTVLEEGAEPTAGKSLPVNGSATYKVRVEFKRDITEEDLDLASNKTLDLSFLIPYEQV